MRIGLMAEPFAASLEDIKIENDAISVINKMVLILTVMGSIIPIAIKTEFIHPVINFI